MSTIQTSLLSHLHRLMPAQGADTDWLARFIANRDEAAFAHLVGRHGPMVWRLCRRLVGDAHLAEDGFQATFLALARQAASIRRPDALAAWLYGVAYRVAAKARAEHRRRETLGTEAVTECPDPRPHAGSGGGPLARTPIACQEPRQQAGCPLDRRPVERRLRAAPACRG